MATSPPHFIEPEGEFAVDYRSHNGAIILGQDEWSFRTMWTSAADGSIHAYNDGGSEVAVAPDAYAIEDVTPELFSRADFTSRVRTPMVGEVVLWINPNGYVAAIYLSRVTVRPESKSGTVLKARYRILTDRSRDFSRRQDFAVSALNSAAGTALRSFINLPNVVDPAYEEIGIGHNNPPDESKLNRDDYEYVAEQLRSSINYKGSEADLKELIASVEEAAEGIGKAIEYRFGLAREGFYRQMGAMGAIVVAGLALWMTFYGDLNSVGIALKALGSHLFGW
jgi:hypothetical protein